MKAGREEITMEYQYIVYITTREVIDEVSGNEFDLIRGKHQGTQTAKNSLPVEAQFEPLVTGE